MTSLKTVSAPNTPVTIAHLSDVPDRSPVGALVGTVDLVIVRTDDEIAVLYGRCLHRGALMSDGHVTGQDLICGVHGWDYRITTGISAYNNDERLPVFSSWIQGDDIIVDAAEVGAWEKDNPQPYDRDSYQGAYQDSHGAPEEPHVGIIRQLATEGLSKLGHHGPVSAMGVPRDRLPKLGRHPGCHGPTRPSSVARRRRGEYRRHHRPQGHGSARPRHSTLRIRHEFWCLVRGGQSLAGQRCAELAGTGICSGEGGMLPEEQQANSRYFYELASGRFGWDIDKVTKVQAFHFKFGQGAKTGTGGHLPGHKVTGRIAEVRSLDEGEPAVSPATFPNLITLDDYREVAAAVRETGGGIPIGAKLSAQHVEADIDAALDIGVDYIILDGRGGGTGAAPTIFRDHISVPTMAALARARHHLDTSDRSDVTLVITGGLRTHTDFVKALALGADAIAVSNSAMQAIGCIGMRACHTDNCPVGIATQKKDLRLRLIIDDAAARLARFFEASVELMSVLARACGHDSLSDFTIDDLTTFDRTIADLAGVPWGGVPRR